MRKLECSVKTTSVEFHWMVMHIYRTVNPIGWSDIKFVACNLFNIHELFHMTELMNPISILRRQVTIRQKSTCWLDCWILHDSISQTHHRSSHLTLPTFSLPDWSTTGVTNVFFCIVRGNLVRSALLNEKGKKTLVKKVGLTVTVFL